MANKLINFPDGIYSKINTIERYKKNFSASVRNAVVKDIKTEVPEQIQEEVFVHEKKNLLILLRKMKKTINLKKQLSDELFNWIFKDGMRTEADINFYIRYMNTAKEIVDDKAWIDDCIIKIQSRDFDNLNIDIVNHTQKLLYHLLKKSTNYTPDQINKIISGKVKFKEEKEEFIQ